MQPYKYQPKLNSGNLRTRVEIWGNVPYINEIGSTSYQFEKIKAIWSSIIPQTGKLQNQQADTILADVTHKIVVRYSAGKAITNDMQIKTDSRLFEIKYMLNPYERNETLELFCSEKLE